MQNPIQTPALPQIFKCDSPAAGAGPRRASGGTVRRGPWPWPGGKTRNGSVSARATVNAPDTAPEGQSQMDRLTGKPALHPQPAQSAAGHQPDPGQTCATRSPGAKADGQRAPGPGRTPACRHQRKNGPSGPWSLPHRQMTRAAPPAPATPVFRIRTTSPSGRWPGCLFSIRL